jgi:hypothetical protein
MNEIKKGAENLTNSLKKLISYKKVWMTKTNDINKKQLRNRAVRLSKLIANLEVAEIMPIRIAPINWGEIT